MANETVVGAVQQETALGNVVQFMRDIGFFDVVLPFLLIFALVYGIFEKTAILGHDESGAPRRNLNATIAFATAVFFVGSARLVAAVNKALANLGLLLVIIVFFLLSVSTFLDKDHIKLFDPDGNRRYGAWYWFFFVVLLVTVVAIFLEALGWLMPTIDFIKQYWDAGFFGTIVFLLGIALLINWLTKSESSGDGD